MSQTTFRYQKGAPIPAMFFVARLNEVEEFFAPLPLSFDLNCRIQFNALFWYRWPIFGPLAHRLTILNCRPAEEKCEICQCNQEKPLDCCLENKKAGGKGQKRDKLVDKEKSEVGEVKLKTH